MIPILMLATGTEAVWIPLLIAAGTTAASIAITQATASKPEELGIGPDPGDIPSADSAAVRRALRMRRDRSALRIDPPASETGLQIR